MSVNALVLCLPKFSRDSDIAKWLEAACYTLTITPDAKLSQLVEEAVDNIRGAQQDDGYINTYFTVRVFTAIELRECTRLMECHGDGDGYVGS